MERGEVSAHSGLAHISAVTWHLAILSHTLLLSTVGILNIALSKGLCEKETDDIYNTLGTEIMFNAALLNHM